MSGADLVENRFAACAQRFFMEGPGEIGGDSLHRADGIAKRDPIRALAAIHDERILAARQHQLLVAREREAGLRIILRGDDLGGGDEVFRGGGGAGAAARGQKGYIEREGQQQGRAHQLRGRRAACWHHG